MTLDLDLQMAQLEVKLLRAQFNSHFLFNNLNAINFCILQNDNQKASSYLTLFSRYLRRLSGRSSYQDFVRLTEEIETLSQYVQIENLRFARSLRFAVSVDRNIDLEEIWVPSLILHSHIENMIWHNSESQTDEGFLSLGIKKKSGKCHILLEASSMRDEIADSHTRLGTNENELSLALERLRLLNERYGTDFNVEIRKPRSRANGSGLRVDISFTHFIFWKNLDPKSAH